MILVYRWADHSRSNDNDYSLAASLLGPLAVSFHSRRWNSVEASLLKMHAICLKKLNRKDDHIRTVLSLLAKYSASKRQRQKLNQYNRCTLAETHDSRLDDSAINIDKVFQEMVESSKQLPYDIQAPLTNYFDLVSIDQPIKLREDRDGFTLGITLCPLIVTEIGEATLSAWLVGEGDKEGFEISLKSPGNSPLQYPSTYVELGSDVRVFVVPSLHTY